MGNKSLASTLFKIAIKASKEAEKDRKRRQKEYERELKRREREEIREQKQYLRYVKDLERLEIRRLKEIQDNDWIKGKESLENRVIERSELKKKFIDKL